MNLLIYHMEEKMKNKKIIFLLSSILLIFAFLGISNKTQASYLNGNSYARKATRHVRVTKTMHVYRCHTGKYEAANRFYSSGKVKKGTKLYISRWIMSTGGVWVIKSRKYYHNRRTFFVVPGMKANWYKRIK